MRILVRRAYSGWGYLASPAEAPDDAAHGAGFDEAVIALASKQPDLCAADGTAPRLDELAISLVREDYGQYLLEVYRRTAG